MSRVGICIGGVVCALGIGFNSVAVAGDFIINHDDTDLPSLSLALIEKAKTDLHIAYGHTSHGSQVTTGMTGLNTFINGGGLELYYPNNTFRWNDGPLSGALDLDDYFMDGDLGNPDRTTWAARTREYLGEPDQRNHEDVNVVMWSWCGQADTTEANINLYLSLMTQLENDYPDVTFVYMTGHVNGCATDGNLFLRNQQIRDYCLVNNKVLYDFAHIESFDPDGNYYGDKLVTDNCDYDSDGNGSRDRNWALDWQNDENHVEGTDWYSVSCAHSQSLNGNQKAYAAWALWTQIAAMRDPMPGDATMDGRVNEDDAAVLAQNWLQEVDLYIDGDFNADGVVDDLDASILAAHWMDGVEAAAVPEPSTFVLLITLSALLLLRIFRR
ncbi:MAG: PEP-CTERM sorting domain-containing protein [Pirellulales bacterium]|nr:PEP-CTERM sorting domain-containing protein [Pirellulales bacterium]